MQALRLGRVPVGRVAFHRRVAWAILAILVFAVTATLAVFGRLVLVLFVGPAIAFILLAKVLDLGGAGGVYVFYDPCERSRAVFKQRRRTGEQKGGKVPSTLIYGDVVPRLSLPCRGNFRLRF
jgi:hypothetical protein